MSERPVTERTLIDAVRESQHADEMLEYRLAAIEKRLDEHDKRWTRVLQGGGTILLAIVTDVVLRAS